MSDDSPTITFGRSAAVFIVDAHDWTVDEYGYVVHDDEIRHPVTAFHDGEPIQIHEFAGVVIDPETDEPVPLRSDFVSLVEHVKQRLDEEPRKDVNRGP